MHNPVTVLNEISKFAPYYSFNCWKIRNYQSLIWKTEYSIDTDNSKPR